MKKSTLVFAVWVAVALMLTGVRPSNAQFYTQQNLISDGSVPGTPVNHNLVNAWGLASSPTSVWWISDNGTGNTTFYSVDTGITSDKNVPGAMGNKSAPTGLVFNGGTGFFVNITHCRRGEMPARFILSSEDGTISGFCANTWVIAVDNSASGAVYKGLAIAIGTATGDLLYVTNFNAGTVDIFDRNFNPVFTPGAFTDPDLPAGYAPFGIQNLGGTIYVTYAMQDAAKHNDVPGMGNGFVNAFDTAGTLLGRIASKGRLNSPWGLALAPDDFGSFSGDLLIGNYGDGKINAFVPGTSSGGKNKYQQVGQLHSPDGPPLVIDGLWAIAFGSGLPQNGPTNTLFFTAGPGAKTHGLFGALVVAPKGNGP